MKKLVTVFSWLLVLFATLSVYGSTPNVGVNAEAPYQFIVENLSYESGRIRVIKAKCPYCTSGYINGNACSYCTPSEAAGFNGVFIELYFEYARDLSYCDVTAYIHSSRGAECILYDSGAWGLYLAYSHEQASYRFFKSSSESYILSLWVSGFGNHFQNFYFSW